ncbi:F-box only protein 6-like, partial [Trifolium medium]|nr:F-box only protein 6-like [Trifolium medium]
SMEPLSTKKFRRDRNIGKSSTLSSITGVMKPQIWKKNPEDIFEVVLARLPLAAIFCFRIVCRQWNNLLGSQSFSQHCTQVSEANPWFYATFGNNNYGAIYDPSIKRWYCPIVTLENPVIQVSSAWGLV